MSLIVRSNTFASRSAGEVRLPPEVHGSPMTDSVSKEAGPATDLQHLLNMLTGEAPTALTFAQIEAAMEAIGLDPFEAEECYEQVIAALEQRQILVVEALDSDEGWVDEDADAEATADEVVKMLANATANADEYRHPLLSAKEERRLLEIYQDGKRARAELTRDLTPIQQRAAQRRIDAADRALDTLIRHNLRLVAKIALRVAPFAHHMLLDDLLQEGRLGLFKAIERYDLNMGLRLSTYATWWIRQSIGRALADQDRTIRLPVHVVETVRRMRQVGQRLSDALGREPTDEELADAIHLPLMKVQTLRRMARDPISLELPVGSEENTLLGDLLPDQRVLSPLDSVSHKALQEAIRMVLDQLTPRERRVIKLRFGLEDGHRRTLEEVGREFGVTRERIRQIEVKALRRLKHPVVARLLRDYFE